MLHRTLFAFALATSTLLAPTALAGPPATRIDPVVDVMHGEEIIDNYRWLEPLEKESDEVREWTTLQNNYTRSILDNLPGRAELEKRLAELMSIGSVSTPSMRGNRYFYTERQGDQNQSVLYLREGHDGEPRVLLDPNTLDEKGLYSLDWYVPSPDGNLLAFGLSYAGDEMTVLYVMDVASGEWLADQISGKVNFSGWMPDASGFLYGVLEDPSNAYSRAFRFHTLGKHPRQNPLLFMQEEPSRIPFASLSKDGRWIIAGHFEGWAKQDVYAIDADRWRRTGDVQKTPIAVGLDARFASQIVHGDTLYLFTTLDAPNGMLYAVDLNNPQRTNWREILPTRNDAVLRGVSHARGIIVASYQKNAATRLERFRMDGTPLGEINLPGLGTAGIATEDDRTEAYLSYTSFNEPPSIYRVDLAPGSAGRDLWARPAVPVDPSTVEVKQEWTVSKDGARVPMFIVHKKGLKLDGNNPTLLYAYGGFNIPMNPSFNATNFPWFERGGVYVLANLRGGGEFGGDWHRAGMLESKQNVYNDFYAAAEHLIERGYTNPKKLAIFGGSNGGLLIGVAVTQRPDLFAAGISAVPLLDMLRYHNFLMARFWIPEYGSPDESEHFSWLRAYSPYHNIKPGVKYPSVLFTAGENDNRVHPFHARKMAAAMQAMAANDHETKPILLWVERDSGHGAGKPLHLRIRDVADRLSYFMWQTGMN